MKNSLHILRYGTHSEMKYFKDLSNTYDMVALNANLLAYSPGSIAELMISHCLGKKSGGFFIDPLTHAFQHNIESLKSDEKDPEKKKISKKKDEIKKSVEKLIEQYGDPISIILSQKRTVKPSDFATQPIIDEFTSRVINFQKDTILKAINNMGYEEFLCDNEECTHKLEPTFLVPPYFYLPEVAFSEWLPLNEAFIKSAFEQYSADSERIAAQLVIPKDLLCSPEISTIIGKYKDTGVKTILLWVDDFDEHKVSTIELNCFMDLIRDFNECGIEVINLYGGYFSVLLTSKESPALLKGVGHALEYGESRGVIPVGGGLPSSKYYFRDLHERLDFKQAFNLLSKFGFRFQSNSNEHEKYFAEICKCHPCRKEIIIDDINNFKKFESTKPYTYKIRGTERRGNYADTDTKEVCIRHYQYNKAIEHISVQNKPLPELINTLRSIQNNFVNIDIDESFYSHLFRWVNVIGKRL